MEAIRTVDLTRRFGDVTAVDRLSLTVHEGELFALLGVNGAGKTTTIRMLCCLTRPTSGDAFVEGASVVSQTRRVKEAIAVCPQGSALAESLSVRDNLTLMARIYGRPASALEDVVRNLELGPWLRHRVATLSGGWQRRASIAMGLIADPRVLFLDEPTASLDVLARRELWDVIRALHGRTTVMLTTHNMEEAEQLADRVGVMSAGRLLSVGTVDELEKRTATDTLEDAFVALSRKGGAA